MKTELKRLEVKHSMSNLQIIKKLMKDGLISKDKDYEGNKIWLVHFPAGGETIGEEEWMFSVQDICDIYRGQM
jgi:hypothetical protein